ncbi:uncharacterized protein F5891DRAFT_976366 [Suillus fuscotomentosus]|uniref:Uncharacterized protein n=1 Tax=Suillus fuscotomentosus TaxID=1912939 RepID=A0AAD4EI42_9AGAM|nr:uncharacterized protein F5891DRAFT_976366 [Suillus fuscotomentosus]KAG1905434.1 hypothetical protein F5891DRAFT_976366 [Suillus fuscotomentosus]
MTSTVHTDSEDEPIVHSRPICRIKPTAALLQHSEKATLPSQTKAINEFRATEAAKRALEVSAQPKPMPPPPTAIPSSNVPPPPSPIPSSNKHLHPDDAFVNIKDESVDEDHDSVCENARINPKPHRKKQKAPEKSPELVDGDEVLIDIDVSIVDPGSSQEGKTADIDAFFGATFEQTGANGKVKKH